MRERVELSCYTSLGSGISKPEKLINRAKELGMNALGITDMNSVLAYPNVADQVRDSQFKIIYGARLSVFNTRLDGKEQFYITVLAKNREGIKSIYKLLSMILTDENKDALCIETVLKYKENIIIGADRMVGEFLDYLEVIPEDSADVVEETLAIGEQQRIPVVAVGRVHYCGIEDAFLNEVLYGRTDSSHERFLTSTEEMLQRFDYLSENLARKIVIENSNLIADRIENDIEPICRDVSYDTQKS